MKADPQLLHLISSIIINWRTTQSSQPARAHQCCSWLVGYWFSRVLRRWLSWGRYTKIDQDFHQSALSLSSSSIISLNVPSKSPLSIDLARRNKKSCCLAGLPHFKARNSSGNECLDGDCNFSWSSILLVSISSRSSQPAMAWQSCLVIWLSFGLFKSVGGGYP